MGEHRTALTAQGTLSWRGSWSPQEQLYSGPSGENEEEKAGSLRTAMASPVTTAAPTPPWSLGPSRPSSVC